MVTFDESKPFGTVRGLAGARYEQNGYLFNARKEPVNAKGEVLASAPLPKAETAPKPAAEPKKPRSRRKPKAAPEGVKSMAELAKEDEQ